MQPLDGQPIAHAGLERPLLRVELASDRAHRGTQIHLDGWMANRHIHQVEYAQALLHRTGEPPGMESTLKPPIVCPCRLRDTHIAAQAALSLVH